MKSYESMSPGELLVALYDRAIQDLRDAQTAMAEENWDVFVDRLDHFSQIIVHFTQSYDQSVPGTEDLYRLYDFLLYDAKRLLSGGEQYKKEIPAMIEIVTNIRDGFKNAEKKTEEIVNQKV